MYNDNMLLLSVTVIFSCADISAGTNILYITL